MVKEEQIDEKTIKSAIEYVGIPKKEMNEMFAHLRLCPSSKNIDPAFFDDKIAIQVADLLGVCVNSYLGLTEEECMYKSNESLFISRGLDKVDIFEYINRKSEFVKEPKDGNYSHVGNITVVGYPVNINGGGFDIKTKYFKKGSGYIYVTFHSDPFHNYFNCLEIHSGDKIKLNNVKVLRHNNSSDFSSNLLLAGDEFTNIKILKRRIEIPIEPLCARSQIKVIKAPRVKIRKLQKAGRNKR